MTSKTKSHVFLIELTIAILVFALAAAIVLGLFVKADQTSSRSQLTTIALAISQSIAEQVKASESTAQAHQAASAATLYFDQSGALVQDQADAAFQIRTNLTQESRTQGIMTTVTIIAEIISPAFSGSPSDQQEPLLSLTVKKYFSGEEAIR